MSADPLNCVAECYFCTYPPSLSVMIPAAHPPFSSSSFPPPLSHVHFRVVSFSDRTTHVAFVLFNTESLYLRWFLKMLFNRLAVSLRTLQKLTKAHRWHHTSLTSSCVFPFSHLNILFIKMFHFGQLVHFDYRITTWNILQDYFYSIRAKLVMLHFQRNSTNS